MDGNYFCLPRKDYWPRRRKLVHYLKCVNAVVECVSITFRSISKTEKLFELRPTWTHRITWEDDLVSQKGKLENPAIHILVFKFLLFLANTRNEKLIKNGQ